MPTSTGDFRTPGQLIQALLNERGWSQNVLAIVLGVSPTVVTRMVNAQRPIDAKMALALSETFEISAERFLALQRSYDLAMAEIQTPADPQRAIRAKLYGGLPIREMAERGWISVDDLRDTDRVEKELAAFFCGVVSPRY